MNFDQMFLQATGRPPFPFQRELALVPALPQALCAPTGAGKTAAAALSWVYRRRFALEHVRSETPRRLVFCLPMRTLVTQTRDVITEWLRRMDLLDRIGVHVLLGGDPGDAWYLHPEREAILVGTQDMLLSRALGRGYGCSRFLWPWLYGLLSNDCLWVFDEIQLMGPGLATGLQLAGLRAVMKTFGSSHSLFMSATLAPAWLRTIDHPEPPAERILRLSQADLDSPTLLARRQACKVLHRAAAVITKTPKDFEGKLAAEILSFHERGRLTLVVLNTVERARGVSAALEKHKDARGVPVRLLHSRFRPADRDRILGEVLTPGFHGVLVSTQVVEAGVDLSAQTLFMELSPWASLVQRAGRCNRAGEFAAGARVFWIDHADEAQTCKPYKEDELKAARGHLGGLRSFNPEAIERAGVDLGRYEPDHVLRLRDVLDLFDTTPDLGGVDLDVSRFIRDGDDRDVQVFWRRLPGPLPGTLVDVEIQRPGREELCAIPRGELQEWVRGKRRAHVWDTLDGEWRQIRESEVVTGGVYLLRAEDGGYTPERGWDRGETQPVADLGPKDQAGAGPEEAQGDDPVSELGQPVELSVHAMDTRNEAAAIVTGLGFLQEALGATVVRAAQAHDLGKAHQVFQDSMYRPEPRGATLLAKSIPRPGQRMRHARSGFRHELASALAWLQLGWGEDQDLVAYLLAAHHGKVRMSLRALPSDAEPDDGRLHARGVWDGDVLPAADLGEGLRTEEVQLSLQPMRLGRGPEGAPSWAERALGLLDKYGPFRLAYLEALVRAADWRASMREKAGR